jgi:NOL1/NOP2/fmu family ribosome biogenesis protein
MPKTGQIPGFPEFGDLEGKQVPMTYEAVAALSESQKTVIIIEVDGERFRPWRFASSGSDYKTA